MTDHVREILEYRTTLAEGIKSTENLLTEDQIQTVMKKAANMPGGLLLAKLRIMFTLAQAAVKTKRITDEAPEPDQWKKFMESLKVHLKADASGDVEPDWVESKIAEIINKQKAEFARLEIQYVKEWAKEVRINDISPFRAEKTHGRQMDEDELVELYRSIATASIREKCQCPKVTDDSISKRLEAYLGSVQPTQQQQIEAIKKATKKIRKDIFNVPKVFNMPLI